MSLKTYQQKRDFKKTSEPKGAPQKRVFKNPLFVVHEHWASHHHFDFRLEIGGVLKSWAVPKTPPLVKTEKRLAVQVEDHPLEYARFHGVIPKGQYGAGRVAIWDRGVIKDLKQENNLIEFELKGKRLTGRYALVHPSKFEKKNWLLLKRD
jgi:bifunctional non-homologous end joining protein LigD